MTNTLRLVDGATTIWLRPAVPSAGDAIVCVSHELALAGPRVVDQPRTGRSGKTDLTALHDGSTFRASLVVRDVSGGATRHETADTLRALLAAWKRPYLYVQRDGWPAERRCVLRGDSLTNPIDRASAARLEMSAQWAIPEGVLEDPTQQTVTLRPTSVHSGRSYPKSYARSYAAAGAGTTVQATSAGTVPTPPLLRLYGDFTEPVVTNQTTGEALELDSVSVAAGQYLEIDVANRTVLLNGDPSLSYYSKLNFAASTWWELQPGANQISMTTASQGATAELDILWHDRWM